MTEAEVSCAWRKPIRFFINGYRSTDPLFALDVESGNITTLVVFDREVQDSYEMVVSVTDNGSPSALPGRKTRHS